MNDLISRQAAIDGKILITRSNGLEIYSDEAVPVTYLQSLPSAEPEQTKMIKEIRKWINSRNRGSADYFIVDKIEEIINKYEQ